MLQNTINYNGTIQASHCIPRMYIAKLQLQRIENVKIISFTNVFTNTYHIQNF